MKDLYYNLWQCLKTILAIISFVFSILASFHGYDEKRIDIIFISIILLVCSISLFTSEL